MKLLLTLLICIQLQASENDPHAQKFLKSSTLGFINAAVAVYPKTCALRLKTLKQTHIDFHYPYHYQQIKKINLFQGDHLVILRQLLAGMVKIPFQTFMPEILKNTYGITPVYASLCAGILQGLTESLITHPIDYYRVTLQARYLPLTNQETPRFRDIRRGFILYSMGNTINAALFMSMLNTIEKIYKKHSGKGNLTMSDAFIESVIISPIQTILWFPFDTIKTNLQVQKSGGFIDTMKHIYRRTNIKGFYRGLAPSLSYNLFATFLAITAINSCKNS